MVFYSHFFLIFFAALRVHASGSEFDLSKSSVINYSNSMIGGHTVSGVVKESLPLDEVVFEISCKTRRSSGRFFEVNLSHNFIDDQAAPSLVELGSLPLKRLDLSFNHLGSVGIRKVLESFQQLLCYNSNFTYLDLLGNPGATPFHVKLYAKEILGQAASAATLETMIGKIRC